MLMFQSVSRHSSEQSIASHYSWPAVLQLKCVSDTTDIKLIWESPTTKGKKSPPSLLALFSFKIRIEWSPGLPQPQVFRGYSVFNSSNIQGNVSQGSQGWSDEENWLDFSSIFFKIFRFRSLIRLSSRRVTLDDARGRFDSGVLFLDQSIFFAAPTLKNTKKSHLA